MALDAPNVWAAQIVAAIQAIGVTDTAAITNAQLVQVWQAVKTIDTTQLGQADVAAGAFTSPAGAVTGVGGPVT